MHQFGYHGGAARSSLPDRLHSFRAGASTIPEYPDQRVASIRRGAAKVPDKPNIVLLMPDQQRADMLGSTGDPIAKTPSTDRLAGEGVQFNNVYVQGPLCMPARVKHADERIGQLNGYGFAEVLENRTASSGFSACKADLSKIAIGPIVCRNYLLPRRTHPSGKHGLFSLIH